jgi:hypothetical protein
MSDLGNIGHVIAARIVASNNTFGGRATAVVEGSDAGAGAAIIVTQRSARVATARADAAGVWRVYGLDDGTYWASEVGALRAWLVEIVGGAVTVTLQTGGGGGETVVAGYAWARIG